MVFDPNRVAEEDRFSASNDGMSFIGSVGMATHATKCVNTASMESQDINSLERESNNCTCAETSNAPLLAAIGSINTMEVQKTVEVQWIKVVRI